MQAESILSIFVPPEGYRGDFGYVCGFTLHQDILAEMTARFTENIRRRRISLAVFPHPPEHHLPLIPGLQILYPRGDLNCGLLHAKVALLRFAQGRKSIVRLVVLTGNWTHETLHDSIDLYWCTQWDSAAVDGQAASNVLAAAEMFDWLKEQFDTSILDLEAEGAPPETALRADLERMRRQHGRPQPQFITNIKLPLLDEIIEHARGNAPARRNRLVMGSGFFESGTAGVLPDVVKRLQTEKLLTVGAGIEVILNPANCQGIAEQAEGLQASRDASWRFLAPRATGAQTWLHAKFLFSASGQQNCTKAWCYLGSGNLSRRGMQLLAGPSGNLEAGVVFEPHGLVWDHTAPQWVGNHLPISGHEVDPKRLQHGSDFEPPGQGVVATPVSYLVWKDDHLHLPEMVPPDTAVSIFDSYGQETRLPFRWTPPPAVVSLAQSRAQVPVLSDGGFVLPPAEPMRIEDVLAALPLFPEGLPVEDDRADGSEHWGAEDLGAQGYNAGDYPVRRIMRLIVGFCDRQPGIKAEDWARWTNRCEELFLALIALEAELFDQVRGFGIDPLDALLQPAFLPAWMTAKDQGAAEHARMLDRVRKAWGTEGLSPMFGAMR